MDKIERLEEEFSEDWLDAMRDTINELVEGHNEIIKRIELLENAPKAD